VNLLGGILADLRERRLLPVAIALAVALVAVPLLLLKSGDTGTSAAPDSTSGAPATASRPPLVALAALRTSSSLDTFVSKNPFDAPETVPELTSTDLLDTALSSGGSGSGDGGGSSSSSGGGSISSAGGGSGGSGESVGSIGGGSAPPSSPDAPPSSGDAPADGDGETTLTKALFTHEIDITYAAGDEVRTIKDIRRLSLLPSTETPQLVFLGVDPTATTALFLVDGEFDQSGEGVCRPSPENCRFLSLKVDDDQDEHLLLDSEQNEFYFRLRNIDRVMINPTAGASSLSVLPPLVDVAEIAVAAPGRS